MLKSLLLTVTLVATAAADLSKLKDVRKSYIQTIEVHGENPTVIYVPIIHDGPLNHASSTDLSDCKNILAECHQIANFLYQDHNVQNIVLEGCGKQVADYYKNPKRKGKKISFKHTKMITFKTWGDILNDNVWNLAPTTSGKPKYGKMSVLGSTYSKRIYNALDQSKKNGWFSSKEKFDENQEAFQKAINDAIAGYNEKRAQILKDDPDLKKDYDITVGYRNREFIKNLTALEGPGIIMCGCGHLHDMKAQLEAQKISYAVVVPKTLSWPIEKKTDKQIFQDMLNLGCQLKKVGLRLGDGVPIEVKIPID